MATKEGTYGAGKSRHKSRPTLKGRYAHTSPNAPSYLTNGHPDLERRKKSDHSHLLETKARGMDRERRGCGP